MTIQPGANLYTIAFGSRPENVEVPFITNRAPTTSDVGFPLGKRWVYINNAEYTLTGITASNGLYTANWALLGTNSGALNTLTGDTGGALTPAAGNINILGGAGITVAGAGSTLTVSLTGGGTAIDSFVPDAGTNPVVPTAAGAVTMAGTANQITTTGGLNTLTFSVPATFIAPGSIASTTTMTSGGAFTVTTGGATITAGGLTVSAGGAAITGTTNINTTGAATTTIGTGGTGAVNIGNATGNTAVTGSLTASTGLTATAGGVTATAGDITATAGNLVATAGNLNLNGATSKINLNVATGASASAGTTAAMVAGVVTVTSSAITTSSIIIYARQTLGTVMGNVSITAQPNGSFTLTSDQVTETSTFYWWAIN